MTLRPGVYTIAVLAGRPGHGRRVVQLAFAVDRRHLLVRLPLARAHAIDARCAAAAAMRRQARSGGAAHAEAGVVGGASAPPAGPAAVAANRAVAPPTVPAADVEPPGAPPASAELAGLEAATAAANLAAAVGEAVARHPWAPTPARAPGRSARPKGAPSTRAVTVPATLAAPPRIPPSNNSASRAAGAAAAGRTGSTFPLWLLLAALAVAAALTIAMLARARTLRAGRLVTITTLRAREPEPTEAARNDHAKRHLPQPENGNQEDESARPPTLVAAPGLAAAAIREAEESGAGAQTAPLAEQRGAFRGATLPPAPMPDVCTIEAWRGYVKTQFYAARPGARDEAVAASPLFRAPGGNQPERTPAAEQALAELLAELQRKGWKVTAEGRRWFDRRLVREPPASRP
jgi:hypothetical protein